jgi:hypothetical protein
MKPLAPLPAAGAPREKHRRETELSINKGSEREVVNKYYCEQHEDGRVVGKEGRGNDAAYEANPDDRNHEIYQG